MIVLLIGSLFCALKTYTRTVFIGAILFWLVYFWFWKKKYCFLIVIFAAMFSILESQNVTKIVLQQNVKPGGSINANAASSGRFFLWEHNMDLFLKMPFTTKILGVGLGNDLKIAPGTNSMWAGSHNDYLSLLITTGVIGLTLYLLIYSILFISIMRSPLQIRIRMFFLGVLFAVIVMNFISNSYIVRFQMAQLFWFLIGLMHSLQSIEQKVMAPMNTKMETSTMVWK